MRSSKPIIQLRTVESTGSHFVFHLLRGNGFKVNLHHFTKHPVEGFAVCPIRDPWDTYVTWQTKNYESEFNKFDVQWERFNKAFLGNDQIFILPIDTEDKEHHLSMLGERLNTKLHTQWKKEGSVAPRKKHVEKVDLSHIFKLPVVEKFYV